MDKEEKEQHIEVFLNNCKILASWAKDEIKRAIGSEGNKCYLNLAAEYVLLFFRILFVLQTICFGYHLNFVDHSKIFFVVLVMHLDGE